MKDIKSLYLLIFALILITISFILISIWGYHFYFAHPRDNIVTQNAVEVKKAAKPLSSSNNNINIVNDTVGTEKKISSTASDSMIEVKLAEIDKLTDEIRQILINKTSSGENAAGSKQITQLKQSVDDLRSQNYEVQKENARLDKMMEELVANKSVNKKNEDLESGNSKTVSKSAASLPLLVAHLRFTAFTGNRQVPTSLASKTAYLTGSFIIKVKPGNASRRIYIVIVEPNGKILLEDAKKPHVFKTGSGTKEYSVALPFNETDDQKRLHFSISSPSFEKGEYKMRIYHEGILIGRMNRILY